MTSGAAQEESLEKRGWGVGGPVEVQNTALYTSNGVIIP